MMVTNSPSQIVNDTPRRACTVSSPTTKFRRMCSSSMMGRCAMALLLFILVLVGRAGHEGGAFLVARGGFVLSRRGGGCGFEHYGGALLGAGDYLGECAVADADLYGQGSEGVALALPENLVGGVFTDGGGFLHNAVLTDDFRIGAEAERLAVPPQLAAHGMALPQVQPGHQPEGPPPGQRPALPDR